MPEIDWNDIDLTFIDLTGDGLADDLLTDDGFFRFYTSLGVEGFDLAEGVRTPGNEELSPKVVLADGTQTICLADIDGAGNSRLVVYRGGWCARLVQPVWQRLVGS